MINRSEQLVKLYKDGMTLEALGTRFNITRERVRQIISKQLEREILADFDSTALTPEELRLVKVAIKEEVGEIVKRRKEVAHKIYDKEASERIDKKIRQIPNLAAFDTIVGLARALNEDSEDIKRYAPEAVHDILNLVKRRWCRKYNKCRNCGTTTIAHRCLGLCESCYPKSEHFKQIQANSFLRHIDKRKEQTKAYLKEYNKRPEIIEKHKKRHDLLHFGGNREKALARDGYKCQNCGLTQQQSLKRTDSDLIVKHLQGNNNHELDNLITTCRRCHTLSMRTYLKAATTGKTKSKFDLP